MQAFARYSLLLACLLAAATVAPLRAEEAQEEVEPMSEKTAYEILGVNKRTSDKEIKRIFKEKRLVSPGRSRNRHVHPPTSRTLARALTLALPSPAYLCLCLFPFCSLCSLPRRKDPSPGQGGGKRGGLQGTQDRL